MNSEADGLTHELETFCLQRGADLFGFTETCERVHFSSGVC